MGFILACSSSSPHCLETPSPPSPTTLCLCHLQSHQAKCLGWRGSENQPAQPFQPPSMPVGCGVPFCLACPLHAEKVGQILFHKPPPPPQDLGLFPFGRGSRRKEGEEEWRWDLSPLIPSPSIPFAPPFYLPPFYNIH